MEDFSDDNDIDGEINGLSDVDDFRNFDKFIYSNI